MKVIPVTRAALIIVKPDKGLGPKRHLVLYTALKLQEYIMWQSRVENQRLFCRVFLLHRHIRSTVSPNYML